MFSNVGGKRSSDTFSLNFIVKEEWDEAESWLRLRPEGDN
jgi:hypothetical protein